VPKLSYTELIMALQTSMWDQIMSIIDCRKSTSANWTKIVKKDKIVKNCNSPRLPWEEVTAPKGAAAHSLGTTVLYGLCKFINVVFFHLSVPLIRHMTSRILIPTPFSPLQWTLVTVGNGVRNKKWHWHRSIPCKSCISVAIEIDCSPHKFCSLFNPRV